MGIICLQRALTVGGILCDLSLIESKFRTFRFNTGKLLLSMCVLGDQVVRRTGYNFIFVFFLVTATFEFLIGLKHAVVCLVFASMLFN